tara:strand:- start:36 stop:224 length:189 start_codon:yes stop_codon:yes gene_type:complete
MRSSQCFGYIYLIPERGLRFAGKKRGHALTRIPSIPGYESLPESVIILFWFRRYIFWFSRFI